MHPLRFCLLLVAALWSLASQARDFVVFGDSLSDGGNAALAVLGTGASFEQIPFMPPPLGNDLDRIPAAPYALDPANPFAARFSDGPVWIEQLAARGGALLLPSLAGGTNYAFGGAASGPLPGIPADFVPTLRQQADQYLAALGGGVIADGTVHVVFGGGNDVRQSLGTTDYRQLLALVNASAGNVQGIVRDLLAAGADEVLVMLVPNVGLAPDVRLAGLERQATFASAAINIVLLGKLKPQLASRKVRVLDTFGLVSRVAVRPKRYGLTEVKAPCVDFGSICTAPGQYLFWDGIHPTTRTHSILADSAGRLLDR